ncbi:primase-helicase family protein [Mesorhizobium sp. M1406]|uniref:primase-helicase family protein n=1 Tax=Mesorhizobium sp. M1406 TaxID=2957099 RepID=UPI00333A0458
MTATTSFDPLTPFRAAVHGRHGVRLAFVDRDEARDAAARLTPSYILYGDRDSTHLVYLVADHEGELAKALVARWQEQDTDDAYVEFDVLGADDDYRLCDDDAKHLAEGGKFDIVTVAEIETAFSPSAESTLNDASVIGELGPDILNTKLQIAFAGKCDAKVFANSKEAPFSNFLNSDLTKIRVGNKDGKCFVLGVLKDGRRTNNAVIRLHMMGLDVDSGENMAKTIAMLRSKGLFFIAYTTHSHGSQKIDYKKDRFIKWAGDNGHPAKLDDLSSDEANRLVRLFMTDEGKYVGDVIASAEYVDTTHEVDGIKINLRCRPLDKFRLVFILHKPYVMAQQPGSQKDAQAAWGDMILGLASELGIKVDRAARDCARLFYLPSKAPGATDARIIVNAGKKLDWTTITKVSAKDYKAAPTDPFDAAGGDMGGADDRDRLMIGSFNLRKWAAIFGGHFEPTNVFADHCPEHRRMERSPSKFACICPHGEGHGSEGTEDDPGAYIEDAGYAERFAFHCSHDSCADHDALDRIKRAIEMDWFPIEALTDPANSCMHPEDFAKALEDFGVAGDGVPSGEHPPTEKPTTHFKKMESAIAALNNEIAIVQRGGDAVIFQKRSNGEGWLKLRAAKDIYAPWTAGKDRDSVFSAWLKSPARDHRTAVVFEPHRYGQPDNTPPDELNMYRGFAIEPAKGDWLDLQRHVFRIICNGDKRLYAYVNAWLADMVQNPGRKIGTALAILSIEGTGKSLFTDFVRQVWGNRHSVKVSDPRQLTGNFNGHMSGKMLAVAEEAFFAGDPKIDSIIKDMITSDRMMMENKFMDAIEVGDYRRFILLSNAENVVRATGDARRYAVTVASAEMKGNTAYFQKLADQLRGGKVAAAMLYDLLRLDIAAVEHAYGVDLRNPPLTDALISQILINMKAEDRWLRAVLADGTFTNADGDSELTEPERKKWADKSVNVAKETVYRSYRSMVKARDGKEVSPEAISMFFIGAFRKQKGEPSLIKTDGDGKTGRSFVLPSLLALREFYAEKSKVPLDYTSVVSAGDLILPPKRAEGVDYDAALVAYESVADTFINGVFDRE